MGHSNKTIFTTFDESVNREVPRTGERRGPEDERREKQKEESRKAER